MEEVGCGGVGVLRPLALTRRAWLRAQMSQRRPLASIRKEGHSVQESGTATLGWRHSTAKSPPCEKQTLFQLLNQIALKTLQVDHMSEKKIILSVEVWKK